MWKDGFLWGCTIAFYEFSWYQQNRIMERSALEEGSRKKKFLILYAVAVGMLCLAMVLHESAFVSLLFSWIACIAVFVSSYFDISTNTNYSLTNVFSSGEKPGFVKHTLCYLFISFTLSFLVGVFALRFFDNSNPVIDAVFFYVATIVVPVISYVSRVVLAQCKIATLFNGVFSALLLILLELKNAFICLLPSNLESALIPTKLFEDSGYSFSQILDVGLTAVLVPFLVLFVLGALASLGKEYWIKKYNNDNDITYVAPPRHMRTEEAPAKQLAGFIEKRIRKAVNVESHESQFDVRN